MIKEISILSTIHFSTVVLFDTPVTVVYAHIFHEAY